MNPFAIMSTWNDMLSMAWDVLAWVMENIWLLCLLLFLVVMVKTILDLARKAAATAAPGWKKLMGPSRKR